MLVGAMTSVDRLAHAASGSGGLASYRWETGLNLGLDLPTKIRGTVGVIPTQSLRAAFQPGGTLFGFETGFLHQSSNGGQLWTWDLGLRKDFNTEDINAAISFGYHVSYFSLHPVLDSSGACYYEGCPVATGLHTGPYLTTAIFTPLTPKLPLRFAMSYYFNPNLWILVELGLAMRF